MRILNLTPHALTFISANNNMERYIVEPSGVVARVAAHTESIGSITTDDGFTIPLTTTVFGQVEGLPAPEEGVVYVVSSLVADRVPDRKDVYIPNESIRDDKGRIIGCLSLGKI